MNMSRHCWLLLLTLLMLLPAGTAYMETSGIPDLAGQLNLDMQSGSLKAEVTVETFSDGDTIRVNGLDQVSDPCIIRFIGCDTPESTGRIEPWGKVASRFTRERLEQAESILIESETNAWETDGTSRRILGWVWYRPKGSEQYRNLNIELIQEGLATIRSVTRLRYGETCLAAEAQARAQGLRLYGQEPDPEFDYGDATEVTIRELRLHPDAYEGRKVACTGIVTMHHDKSVYLEAWDAESGLNFGLSAFYGYHLSPAGLRILSVGNEVRVVGTFQYYEPGQVWQISGLEYRAIRPDAPDNLRLIREGCLPSWQEISPETFLSNCTLDTEEGTLEIPYTELLMNATVSMTMQATLTESDTEGQNCLLCTLPGNGSIRVYTPFAVDAEGNAITQDALQDHVIRVHGIVTPDHDGCIQVYTQDGITYPD